LANNENIGPVMGNYHYQ